MRYLGIDYGLKRIGLALSDENGILAFPKQILENNLKIIESIKKICQSEKVQEIVIGESFNQKGQPNKIMVEIAKFKKKLKEEINLPIQVQKEFFTTVEARRDFSKTKTRRVKPQKRAVDAGAATLILQRYLDKIKHDSI